MEIDTDPCFWVNPEGSHPTPGTIITADDIKSGRWKVNPEIKNTASSFTADVAHYVRGLQEE